MADIISEVQQARNTNEAQTLGPIQVGTLVEWGPVVGVVVKTDSQGTPVMQPKPVNKADGPVTSTYVTPAAAGSIANTGIAMSNNNRKHVCDTTIYIQRAVKSAQVGVAQMVQTIRAAVKALLEALGIMPAANGNSQFFKKLAEDIAEATQLIKDINDTVQVYLVYVAQIKAVIAYILSLPAALAARFLHCLQEAYSELTRGFFDLIRQNMPEFSPGDDIKRVVEETQALIHQTATLAATGTKITAALAAPPTALNPADQKVVLDTLFPDVAAANDPKRFSKA